MDLANLLIIVKLFQSVTPSDRDIYVKALMEHIKVDSYGSCLHNKDLPEK